MPEYDVTVSATFAKVKYAVTVTTPANGTVTADKADARAGETVTLTVTPDAGYELDSLTVDSPVMTPALTYLRGSREGTDNGSTRMLLDGSKDTKWCEAVSNTPYIIFKADRAFCLTDYTLTTAADTASFGNRNWKDWTIYGANFASDEDAVLNSAAWQPVVTVTNDTTMQAVNGEDYTFTLNEAAPAYQYYKIVITASRGDRDIQMSILSMRGLVRPETQPSSGSDVTFTMPASDVTVSATFKAGAAPVTYTYFVGNSLSLQGDIGVNFYVKLNDVAPANARVEFAWGSGSKAGTQSAALADLTADANGRYKLTVRVAAAQMTDTITAELYDGETPVATQQYSVAKYARYVLGATDAQLLPLVENNADKVTSLRNLCKAMLIYGGKSQQQFKYNTYAPADQNLEYTLSDIPDGVLGTTTFPEGFEAACGIQFYAASLILESKTTYRLYFTVTDQAKLDALGMEYGTSGSYVYFDIANISATEVFKDHSMSFGGLTVTANAGTYATAVLSGENETLKDVVKALYWYSEAAKTFFGVQ